MEWVKLQTLYDSKEKALKTASIVATTESRLANQQRGPQYEVETRVDQVEGKWQVSWRKVFVGFKSGGCGGCQSCHVKPPEPNKNNGKIIPFRKPSVEDK
ncbi:hypothetical protein [Desulfotruncus alcoholivorax]|uniref:hypothetical protein n=1 Tax=Desulfotruncus alcoholivorax TaxID=265477 RepID=UPI0004813DEB|nr:hypothetical protein [Desulfotruncus alcoholivorax]